MVWPHNRIPAAEVGLHYAKWHYGVDLFHANPVDALRNSTTPVLLIHGDADINILPDHSHVLAAANSQSGVLACAWG
jgi:dipeptidyl aminopeptidase/acylaminoacyl peptidase